MAIFLATAALWPSQPKVEDLLLASIDQELGLLPRFLGAKPVLLCRGDNTTVAPALCPGAAPKTFTPQEITHEARWVLDGKSARAEIFRRLLRDPQDRGELQNELEAKLATAPDSPELLNDLAVIHILRAATGEEPAGYAEAFDLLDRAADSEVAPPEVLFNRVFVLASLGLRREARRTAARLANEGQSEWSKLALELLATPTLPNGQDPASRRAKAETLLGEWGQAMEQGNTEEAAEKLAMAKELAEAIAREQGDSLLAESVQAIEGADTETLNRLSWGHAAFFRARGSEAYSSSTKAEDLEIARTELAGRTPFVSWVHLDSAICSFFARDFLGAERYLEKIRIALAGQNYLALQGREGWIRGLVMLRQGRFADAEEAYRYALASFEKLDERAHMVAVTSLRARNYEQLGVQGEAWRYRTEAMARLDALMGDHARRYDLLEEAGEAALRQDRHRLALAYLDQRLLSAEQAGRTAEPFRDLPVFTLLARATALESAGDIEAAQETMDLVARRATGLPPDLATRKQIEVMLAAQKSSLPPLESPATALEAVNQAISFFSSNDLPDGDTLFKLDLLWRKSQIHRSHGQVYPALAVLEDALAEVRRLRVRLEEPELRARLQGMARKLADAKIELELDELNEPWRALSTLESSSNQALYDLMNLPPEEQVVDPNILKRIPAGTRILRYGSLADRVLIFSLERSGLSVVQIPSDREQFRASAAHCQKALPKANGEGRQSCSFLAQSLLPEKLNLDPLSTRRLMVVQDPLTQLAPLLHLRRTPSSDAVAIEFQTEFTLGLPLLLHNAAGAPSPQQAERRFLFVADPDFDRTISPKLRRLSGAAKSSERYNQLPGSIVVAGSHATKARVLAELATATLAQFETHSVISMDRWNTQGLLLATDRAAPHAGASILSGADLLNIDLRQLQIVVLGACSTMPRFQQEYPETLDLAAIFLARGVPLVATTASDISDSVSAATFWDISTKIAAGLDPKTALTGQTVGERRKYRNRVDLVVYSGTF